VKHATQPTTTKNGTNTMKITNTQNLLELLNTIATENPGANFVGGLMVTVKVVAELGNVSTSTARKFLTKNVEAGLVTKVAGRPAMFALSAAGAERVARRIELEAQVAAAQAKREADAIAEKVAEEKATADRLESFAGAPSIPGAADQDDADALMVAARRELGAVELVTEASRYAGEGGHYRGAGLPNSLTRLTIRVAGAGSSYATYSLGGWTAQAEGRLVFQGAKVQGPHAFLGENATCIAANPNAGTAADNARAEAADLMVATEVGALVIAAGSVFRVVAGPRYDTRPKLVGVTASELRRELAEAVGQPEATEVESSGAAIVTEHKAARPDPKRAGNPTWLAELRTVNQAAESFGSPLPFDGSPIAKGGTWKAGTYHELYAGGGTLRAFLADDGTEMARLTYPALEVDAAELEKLRAVLGVDAPSSASDLPRAIADATAAVAGVELKAWNSEVDAVVREVLDASAECFGFAPAADYAAARAAGQDAESYGLELGEALAASGWCE